MCARHTCNSELGLVNCSYNHFNIFNGGVKPSYIIITTYYTSKVYKTRMVGFREKRWLLFLVRYFIRPSLSRRNW